MAKFNPMKRLACNKPVPGPVRHLPRARQRFNPARGFSLIELMIVLVIAAILATVGSAYYNGYVTSANRTEARVALTRTAGSLDKCKVLYGTYNNANCGVGLPFTTENNYYNVTGVIGATTFVLTATPVAGEQQAKDDDCKTFTLNQAGLTGSTGNAVMDCW